MSRKEKSGQPKEPDQHGAMQAPGSQSGGERTSARSASGATHTRSGTAAGEKARTASTPSPDDARFLKEHGDKLSRSTQRAKWINSPGEHEDYPGQTLATRNHEVIRHWAEERNAQPATVPGTEHGGRPGVLRFDFPGYGGEKLQPISWDDWFKTFDERNLVFVFQEHQKAGNQSNFFRLDNPEREDA